MKSSWLKGYTRTKEDRDKRESQVLGYRTAFDDLKEVIVRDFQKREMVRDYDTPNWEYRQVANNEYNAAISDILKLIDLNQKDK